LRRKTSFAHDPHEVTNQLPQGNHTPSRPPRDAVELAMDVLGVRRYGQMQRNLGIARNVLADRLKQLVADGMFDRVRYRTDPDWYEYRLTDRAIDLYPVIVSLMQWAGKHLSDEHSGRMIELTLVHRACGRPTTPYLACSHCHQPMSARDIEATVERPA
jgi:DNA-binding HxlR family transcriptional regulator